MTAKAITVQEPGLPAPPQPLPSFLAELLADPEIAVYGEHGFDTKAGIWSPPAVIDDAIKLSARQALGEYDRVLETKATRRQATEWALSLMMLTGGRHAAVDDAKAKATAYAMMLIDYPAAVLTRDTLNGVAKAFRFFPAYAELAEHLDINVRRLQRERRKLATLAAEPQPVSKARAERIIQSVMRTDAPNPAKGAAA